jgi:2-oxoglutarate ferredoxin oxidoreductase subunit beta
MYLGVSGDGDSASIGIGQFVHAIRRNLNMTYIVMNNGCYGLTKGQDSATADFGSVSKAGSINPYQAIDLVGLALELNASFVGRSFSGDKTQLVPMIKAAMSHPGFALLDVISPCVTFNNNEQSTKSYTHVRAHIEETSIFDFVPREEPIHIEYEEGRSENVELFDGSKIHLHKLAPDWDPTNRKTSFNKLHEAKENGQILTGLIYIDPKSQDLHKVLNTSEKPLNKLSQDELCPGNEKLQEVNMGFR